MDDNANADAGVDPNAGVSDADADTDAGNDTGTNANSGADTGQGNGGPESGGQGDSPDWRASVADEKLRQHAERFADPSALLKAHMDLRAKLSQSVTPPGENASDEDIAEFRERMGVPETKDGYTLPEIEGFEQSDSDVAYQGAMAEVLHRHNISDAAFQELAAAHVQHVKSQMEAQAGKVKEQDDKYVADAEAALRKDWGDDFDANVRFSGEASKSFFDTDIGQMELKGGQLLGSHPDFIRGMAQIGRQLGEGVIHLDPNSDAAGSLTEQADEYAQKRREAMSRGDREAAQKYNKLEQEVLAKLG